MTLYHKDDPDTIKGLFSSVASRYDLTNSILSLGLHKLWNKSLVNRVLKQEHTGPLLDLCCGTGEIAYTYLKNEKNHKEIYLIDFCPEMIAKAKERANKHSHIKDHTLHFIEGDAQHIPLDDDSISAVTIAYGIRNVRNTHRCLKEVFRVLKPSGQLGILELTRPKNKIMKVGHKIYLNAVLPSLGRICTANKAAYEYLCRSIHTFIEPVNLQEQMHSAGFKETAVIPLTGGIAHLIVGNKPQ